MDYGHLEEIELSSIVGVIQKNNWIGNKNFSQQESDKIIEELVDSLNDVADINGKPAFNVYRERNGAIDKRISKATIASLDAVLNCTILHLPANSTRKERDTIRLELQFNQPDESYVEIYEYLKEAFGTYKPRGCTISFMY